MALLTLIFHEPLLLFPVSFFLLALSAWIGARGCARLRARVAESGEDFRVIQGATLTLLGLLIGFTFSMALDRYDQRKNYEEEEANAIGTEYVRVDVLPPADAARVRPLLRDYVEQRVQFYTAADSEALAKIGAETSRLQMELWSAVQKPAAASPNPVTALAVAGMNAVLNSQGYTQAAWRNRIPVAAWVLLFLCAVCSNLLVGIGMKRPKESSILLMILPLVVSVALMLIADIDSPRRGVIKVVPQNLVTLAASLRGSDR